MSLNHPITESGAIRGALLLAAAHAWSLVPVAEDSFASTTDYAAVAILRAGDGSVSGLEWCRGDDAFVLPRVRGLP